MSHIVSYLSQSGRVLKFANPGGLYPVNEYQSLVLVALSEIAAFAQSSRKHLPLNELTAWEPCCGGGPVAVTLKALGLDHVKASDVNEEAIAACQNNAKLNDVALDEVTSTNLLNDGETRSFDLICCNPPCGIASVTAQTPVGKMRQAVDGGRDGMDLTLQLVSQAPHRLASGGSLILIAQSTGNIWRLYDALNEQFPDRWHVMSTTPVAAPWMREDDPRAQTTESQTEVFEPFIWRRGDGWTWRLSWVIEAQKASVNPTDLPHELWSAGFPLHPFGYDVGNDPALAHQITRRSDDGFWLTRDYT